MIQKLFLYEAVELQKAYARLSKKGLVGVRDDYVQLNSQDYVKFFPTIPYKDWEDGWEQKETVYNGVKFICVRQKGGE